jgi:V8-like Glu-specific endopeptidase
MFRKTALTAGVTLLGAALGAGPAAAQKLKIEREKVLYTDMKVAAVGPFVSDPVATTGVLWSRKVAHAAAVPVVRVHVQVRKGRPSADWRIRIRDLSGQEVESFAGGSPLLAAGGIWSGEVPGRGVEVELVSDTDAQGLEIAVDRYAYRVISGISQQITGPDQRIPIRSAPQDVRGWAPPIARLSFISDESQYVCTGFLITRDLLLTNEHCLGQPAAALSAIVEFGFDSPSVTPTTYRVSKLEAASVPLDYALVRLAQAPNGFGHVTLATSPVVDNQDLVIIQHPAGEFKQASIDDCKVKSASRPGVEGGTTDFGHLCDTLGGSSGSPILDRQTGGVVGLHHWGFSTGSPDPVNQGVHIGQVLADLRARVPALHAEITSTNP